ncbi:ion transporter, partial [Escherichia coli]
MLKIMKQHKFAFLLTALLSTFFLNMFPPNAAGYALNTVLQIVAGVNLLQCRHQVVSFIVLLIIFVTTHWLPPINAMTQLFYGSYLVFFI